MKRFIAFFVVMSMLLFPSCSGKQKPADDESKMQVKNKVDTKVAESAMENYMKYLVRKNQIGMMSYYSKDLKASFKEMPEVKEPHPVGYKVEEAKSSKEKVEITAHVYNAYTGKPYYSDDTFKYSFILEEGNVVIDKISKEKSSEVLEKDKKIIMKNGETKMERSLLSIDNLPEYVVPEDAAMPEQKFPVPKDELGPVALSPDGKLLALTSMGKHAFLCTAKIEEVKQTMSLKEGGGKKDTSGGEQKKSSGDEEKGKEEKEGKTQEVTISPVDFYMEGKVRQIAFSPKGKYFVVDYVPAAGYNRIALYSASGKKVNLKLDERFKLDRFSIKAPLFLGEDEIYFIVTAVPDATDEEKKFDGEWTFNIKTMKYTKLNS